MAIRIGSGEWSTAPLRAQRTESLGRGHGSSAVAGPIDAEATRRARWSHPLKFHVG